MNHPCLLASDFPLDLATGTCDGLSARSMEDLEQRLVLSSQPVVGLDQAIPDYVHQGGSGSGSGWQIRAAASIDAYPAGGYSPQQLQGAYGINQVSFGGSRETVRVKRSH